MNTNSYQLFVSLRSPFARRIRLALRRTKLEYQETVLNVFEENPELIAANPFGLVPTLRTPDAGVLFESGNLLDYLHEKTSQIWPTEMKERIQVKQAAVLTAGLMQLTVQLFVETSMHEHPSEMWKKDYSESIERALRKFSEAPAGVWVHQNELTQAGWDLAVSLEYLSLRFPQFQWQSLYPHLQAVVDEARKDAYFLETEPKP